MTHPTWRPALLVVCALGLEVAGASPAHASYVSKVTITSKEMHNTECMDFDWYCRKPELFARAWLVRREGPPDIPCPAGPVAWQDRDNVVEDQVLCDGRNVEGEFKVRFEVWDEDSPTERQQVDLAAGPERGWTTPYWLGPGPTGTYAFTTSGGGSWAAFTVEITPKPTTIVVFSKTIVFDPALGQRALIAGSVADPAKLRITIDLPSGPFELVESPFRNSFNVDWDGRGPDYKVVQPGSYTFHVVDASDFSSQSASATGTLVVDNQAVPRLSIDQLLPARAEYGWDFWGGPVELVAFANRPGQFWLEALPGECYRNNPPRRRIGPINRGMPGAFTVAWDGLDDTGSAVAGAGAWCLQLSGTHMQGPFTSVKTLLSVKSRAKGLEVVASLSPIAPALAPGTTPVIRAFVVDSDEHSNRTAFTLTLEAAQGPQVGGTIPFLPVTTVRPCTRASSCTWPVPPALAGMAAIAWRVTAEEAPGLPGDPARTASTGFRITDLMPTGREVRVDVPATVLDGTVISQAASHMTLDIAYYPGTGFEVSDSGSRPAFLAALERNVNEIRGFDLSGSQRWPSSILDNWANVAILAGPDEARVEATNGRDCSWSGVAGPSYAEAVGILHVVDCRDTNNNHAGGRSFSASVNSFIGSIGWHELHHILFDEADEYCCDGGYFDGINLYNSLSSCESQGSDASTCSQLMGVDPQTGMTQTLPWWRSDVGGQDVMINDTVENADDRRAAKSVFDLCKTGGC